MRAIVIDTGGYTTPYEGSLTLDLLHNTVGGYLEGIALKSDSGVGATMYLNEEGKLRGLVANTIATFLAARYSNVNDVIVGNVIIVGPPDYEGDDTSLDDVWFDILKV